MTTPEFLAAREAAMARQTAGFQGVDQTDPTTAVGFAQGLRVSTRLTTEYRQRVRKLELDVTPQDVVECLRAAGVRRWVLMGLHGYVAYLPMPRATQDVDVMVSFNEKRQAVKALAQRWPMLQQQAFSQVIRFLDPNDDFPDGRPKPVIDLMFPGSPFQETILAKHVVVDPETGMRYPTVEAAIVSKYAPLISPYRDWDKKQQDAIDLRRVIRANFERLDREVLHDLGNQVWEHGGEELLSFVKLALQDKPFPV